MRVYPGAPQVAAGENPLLRKRLTLAKVASTQEWGGKTRRRHAPTRIMAAGAVKAVPVVSTTVQATSDDK